jgi:hypothetical protein
MKSRCLQTQFISAPCAKCGLRPAVLHIPDWVFQPSDDEETPQYYCENCCPICRAATAIERYPD